MLSFVSTSVTLNRLECIALPCAGPSQAVLCISSAMDPRLMKSILKGV